MNAWTRSLFGLVCTFGASGCDVVLGMVPGQLDPIRPVIGEVTSDATWTSEQITRLDGLVRVKPGATLTIDAGARILATKGAGIFVHRGARIVARGTKDKPIVFTSASKTRTAGDWYGIYICGRAPINGAPSHDFPAESAVNAGPNGGFGPDDVCGGDATDDSSGELRFVRIEFAGGESGPDISSSGIELAGVGSGTVIDHLQIHRGGRDAISIYGGTVGLKYVLVTRTNDDLVDWAYGWRGKMQFLAGFGADDGMEAGAGTNDSFGDDPDATEPSSATIYNITLVGESTENGVGLNLNSGIRGQFYNALVVDYGEWGVSVDNDETKDQAVAKALDVRNSIFANEFNFDSEILSNTWHAESWLMVEDPTRNNQVVAINGHGLRKIDSGALDFSQNAGAPGLTGAATPPDDGFFDPNVTFIGACGMTCPEFEGWTDQPLD